METIIIHFEGNIGAGKTTKIKNYCIREKNTFCEEVEKWKSTGIFDELYKNNKSIFFPFQILTLTSQADILLNKILGNENKIYCVERSIYSQRIFAELIFKENNQMQELACYNELFNMLETKIKTEQKGKNIFTLYFYLQTSPEECLSNIQKRGRVEEQNITLEYLKKIDEAHKKFFNYKNDFFKNNNNICLILI